MCWDEFKSVASAESSMSFAYCDAITHQLVDVVQDRKMKNLVRYFNQFPLQTRLNVKTISIDMYAPYIEVIKRLFPKAKIIIDPFHIIQALNRELNKTRTRKMNQVRFKDRRLYNKLKRYWKLILKNRDDLQSYHYSYYRLLDCLTHSQGIVDYLLQEVPSLKPEYETVHQLREVFKERNSNDFKEELLSVQKNICLMDSIVFYKHLRSFYRIYKILVSIQLFLMDLLKELTTRLKYLKETLMATLVSLILEIEFY